MAPETTALVTTTNAIAPRSFDEARSMSEYLAKAALVPAAIARGGAPNVCAIVMAGGELGLAPMAALRAFHVIEGVPKLTADAMVAACLASGACEYFTPIESGPTRSTWETKRRGSPAPVRVTWDMERAKKAGLDQRGNWPKYPAEMLDARAKSGLARRVYPDIVLGLYTPDEDDFEAPIARAGEVEAFAAPPPPAPAKEPPPAKEPKQRKAPAKEAPPAAPARDFPPIPANMEGAVLAPPTVVAPDMPGPAPAARADYEASAARVAQEREAFIAETQGDDWDRPAPAPAAGEPAELRDFRVALAAAQTPEQLQTARAKFAPWAAGPGKAHYAEMKESYATRYREIAAAMEAAPK